MKVNLKLHISFVILLLTTTLSAQNLDKVGKKEMVTVHGGLNFSTITYASDGIAFPSRDPLRWICNHKCSKHQESFKY